MSPRERLPNWLNLLEERERERRELLGRIAGLMTQVRITPDPELREALEAAREELRKFDKERT